MRHIRLLCAALLCAALLVVRSSEAQIVYTPPATAAVATTTTITDDTITAATMYPTWVTATSGNLGIKVSSSKLFFNPSTGLLTATGFSGPLTGNASGSAGTVTSISSHASTELSDTANLARLNAANSFSLINPMTTIAESWIGPSSTTGIYFKSGNVGIGTTGPASKLDIIGADATTVITLRNTNSKSLWLNTNTDGSFSIYDGGGTVEGDPILGITQKSGNVGIGTTTPDTLLDLSKSALATTSTDGLLLQNETAALVGTQVQIGPRFRQTGTGWDVDDVVSRSVSFFTETLPVAGNTVTGTWKLGYIDPVSAAVSYPMMLGSSGGLTTLGSIISGGDLRAAGGNYIYWASRSLLTSPASGLVNMYAAGEAQGVGFDVTTDALLKIRTRAQTGYAAIDTGNHLIGGVLALSATAPTIASGGCTSPAVTWANGTASFKITIGTSCTGVTTVVLTLPAATNGWACHIEDNTTPSTYTPGAQTTSTTSVTISNWSRTTGLASDFVASEVLIGSCIGG